MTRMEALNNGPSSLVLISFFSGNGVSTIDLFRSLVFFRQLPCNYEQSLTGRPLLFLRQIRGGIRLSKVRLGW